LVVVGSDRESAEQVRRAFVEQVRMEQPARDAVAGGLVIGRSLEDVLRVMGGGDEITDDARDLGVVVVLDGGRVQVAHYVRPVERDAAGHLQRRPPGVLSARNASSGALDHFYWASTEELATRAGMERSEFEDAHDARTKQLSGLGSQPNARN
jgi:hypothetical protein